MNFVTDTETAPDLQEKNYQLADENNISDLVGEMNIESGKVNDDDFDNSQIPTFEEEEPELTPGDKQRAQTAAEFVVDTADNLISKLLAAYAKTEPDKLRAKKSDIKDISKHFASYFSPDRFDIPPWIMGAIVAAFVIFDKVKIANEIKRANERLEAEQAKTRDLEAEVKRLKLEKQKYNLENEVENLESEIEQQENLREEE
ncbi:MAG: hypothetical protein K9H26_10775 [Prolixibacteraceae bacterium]|nr:hypothetical protein [Prolixibacteraceae bacterium]